MTDLHVSNVSFGMKIPTKNVIGLAANKCLWKNHFDDNINVIHKLIDNKTNLRDREAMGVCCTFDAVSKVINKQFPQLAPILEELKGLSRFYRKGGGVKPAYYEELNKILNKADKQLGSELDVSTADIEAAVRISDTPLGAYLAGSL